MKIALRKVCSLVFLVVCCGCVLSAAPSAYIIGWGDNSVGAALGTPTVNPPTTSNKATGLVSVADQIITNAVAIAAGGDHGLALTTAGIVVGWGGLTLGNEKVPAFPTNGYVNINGEILTGITGIAASSSIDQECFDLAMTREGRVIAWGGHEFGQTAPPTGLNHVTAIAAGAHQGLALTKDGTVVSWGQGNPPPKGLSNVVALAAGGSSGRNLALKVDGTVIDWPVLSVEYDSAVPSSLSNVIAIAAGGGHSLALKRDGTIIGWGANNAGQVTGVPSPNFPHESTGTVMVAGQVLSNVVKIAAGKEYSMALKGDGTVIVWGHPFGMQLTVPAGLSNVVAIAAGENFCLAITTNSAVADRFRH